VEKSYKYRIYPNKQQKIQLAKNFGCVRFVYNHYLDVRKTAYEEKQETLKYSGGNSRLLVAEMKACFYTLKFTICIVR